MVSDREARIPWISTLPDPWDPHNEGFSVSKYNSTLAYATSSPVSGPFELEMEDINHCKKKPSLCFPGGK